MVDPNEDDIWPINASPNVRKIAVVQQFSREQWEDGMALAPIIRQRLADGVEAALDEQARVQAMTPAERAAWMDEQDRRWEAHHALERDGQLTAAEAKARRCPTCHCDPSEHDRD